MPALVGAGGGQWNKLTEEAVTASRAGIATSGQSVLSRLQRAANNSALTTAGKKVGCHWMSLDSANDASNGNRADPRDPPCLVALEQVSTHICGPIRTVSSKSAHGASTSFPSPAQRGGVAPPPVRDRVP